MVRVYDVTAEKGGDLVTFNVSKTAFQLLELPLEADSDYTLGYSQMKAPDVRFFALPGSPELPPGCSP
jgi:hypothetical protein